MHVSPVTFHRWLACYEIGRLNDSIDYVYDASLFQGQPHFGIVCIGNILDE